MTNEVKETHVYGETTPVVDTEKPVEEAQEPAAEPVVVEHVENVIEPQPLPPVEEPAEESPAEEPQVQQPPVPWFRREPALIMGVVQAAIALAMGFGFDISLEQMGLILTFTAALLALITRQQVTPFVNAGTTPNVNTKQNTPLIR